MQKNTNGGKQLSDIPENSRSNAPENSNEEKKSDSSGHGAALNFNQAKLMPD
jgi:hypothetical protein